MPSLPSSSLKDELKKDTPVPAPEVAGTGKVEVASVRSPVVSQSREMKEKKKRVKKILPFPYLHLLVGLALTGLIGWGLLYTHRKMALLAVEVEQKRSQLTALEGTNIGQLSLGQQYQTVVQEAEVVHQAFPDEETIIEFFKLFRQLVGSARVESFDFETDQPISDPAGDPYIGFGVEVVGTPAEVETFLTRVDRLPYLIDYVLVDLEYSNPAEAKLVLQARLGVGVEFYLTQEEE